jgi:tRNA(Arg) A34 adenosine deaminase TadA
MKPKFFAIARKLSKHSTHSQHKMACVISRGRKIVGLGFNKSKTHPKSMAHYQNIHAEFSAILNGCEEDLEGCVAYVYRETKSGDLGMARPCSACYQALKRVGIKKVYYTTEQGYVEEKIA